MVYPLGNMNVLRNLNNWLVAQGGEFDVTPTRNEYQQKILFEYSGLVGEIVEEQVKRSTKTFSQFY